MVPVNVIRWPFGGSGGGGIGYELGGGRGVVARGARDGGGFARTGARFGEIDGTAFGSGGIGGAGVSVGEAGAPAPDDVTVEVCPTVVWPRPGLLSAGLGVGLASTCVARLPRKLVRTSGEIDTSTATR